MLARLPMNRRNGGGNSTMSVGVATICSRAPVWLLIDVYHFQFAVVFQFRFAQLTDAQDGLADRAVAPPQQSQDELSLDRVSG